MIYNQMTRNQERVWAAGFFDGEGCIMISRRSSKGFTLQVIVVNVEREPLDVLCARWGGGVYFRDRQRANWRPSWSWQLVAANAAVFLGDIQPYVQTPKSKHRISLALRFQAGKMPRGYWISDERVADEQNMAAQMVLLNARGPSAGE